MAINRRHRIENSESILSIGYDPKVHELEITFTQGKAYTYNNVSPAQYADLMNAESIGSEFAQTLKKSHKGTLVDLKKKLGK